ncbi:hypothetical protein D3C84_839780 [compost metagenome]
MRQVLHAAPPTITRMWARYRAAQGAGLENPLHARLDHFAVGLEYPCLDFLASQGAGDEPGAALDKGNAATVIGQALDAQALLLASGYLRCPTSARGLEAQAGITLGHQLAASKRPVDR